MTVKKERVQRILITKNFLRKTGSSYFSLFWFPNGLNSGASVTRGRDSFQAGTPVTGTGSLSGMRRVPETKIIPHQKEKKERKKKKTNFLFWFGLKRLSSMESHRG